VAEAAAAISPREEILVIEPRPDLGSALSRFVSVRQVRAAANAREILRQGRPWLGLVSVEEVGRSSGIELVEFARAQHPSMPALLVLDKPDVVALQRAFSAGAGVLVQPVTAVHLREFARRARAASQSLHPVLLAELDNLARTRGLTPWEIEMLVATIRGRRRDAILRETGLQRDTLKSRVRALLRKCDAPDLASLALALCRTAAVTAGAPTAPPPARPRSKSAAPRARP
jgi:DNA-binding NarL/FixJ family response regulator